MTSTKTGFRRVDPLILLHPSEPAQLSGVFEFLLSLAYPRPAGGGRLAVETQKPSPATFYPAVQSLNSLKCFGRFISSLLGGRTGGGPEDALNPSASRPPHPQGNSTSGAGLAASLERAGATKIRTRSAWPRPSKTVEN
jgi:hypothetical protein